MAGLGGERLTIVSGQFAANWVISMGVTSTFYIITGLTACALSLRASFLGKV